MKVAIPIWKGRVSPVFDTACRMVIVEFEDGRPGERSEFVVKNGGSSARVGLLQDLGATTLICGAISNRTASIVEHCGIELVPWVVGEIDDVIEAFFSDSLGTDGFIMPGCRHRHGRRKICRSENRRGAGGENWRRNGGEGRRRTGGRRNEE